MGHPKIGRPRVDVIVDPLVPSLWRALCRECSYSEGPSVKSYVESLAVTHRKRHRAGELAAPFHGHVFGASS